MITLRSYRVALITCFLHSFLLIEWDLIELGSTSISVPLILDLYGIVFISTVRTITTRVLIFTKFYIAHEKFINRFVILVIIFVISIIFIILFPHAIILLLGWDGLGITSFVLVIYYQTPKSLGAGLLTALTNRTGDVMILLAIAYISSQGHWLIINLWSDHLIKWIIGLIIVAAITKSAQVPFSRWLPAAMAAPTPVRALVHSSTLVTAGVFLLFRFYPLLRKWAMFFYILIWISSITILMAGIRAIVESDIKKIIALSTLRQLGVIIFTLSIGIPVLAFFHLITHALFKALLFICAGYIIDIHHHSQDLRSMGDTARQLPIVTRSILAANLALCGAPFITGFYSKDTIIEQFSITHSDLIILTLFTAATVLTTAYSTRFSLYVLICPPQSPTSQYSRESIPQFSSTIVLAIGAVVGGRAINWMMLPPTTEFPINIPIKLQPLAIISLGLSIGFIAFYKTSLVGPTTRRVNTSIWFLTPSVTHSLQPIIIEPCLAHLKITDQGWNETPQLIFINNFGSSYTYSNSQVNVITIQMLAVSVMLFSLYII